MLATSQPFSMQFPIAGWYLKENPWLGAFVWSADSLTYQEQGGVKHPLKDLVTASSPAMAYYAWTFDPTTNDYVLVTDPTIVPGAKSTVALGQGFWVMAAKPNVTLSIPGTLVTRSADTTTPASPGRSRGIVTADNWTAELVAEAGGARDSGNFLGVTKLSPAGLQIAKPPAIIDRTNYVEMSFRHPNSRGEASRYAVDLRAGAQSRQTWDVAVTTDMADTDVTLRWPDLSTMPSQYRMRLVDLSTGQARAMRTTSYYTFNSGDQPLTPHRFRIELFPREEGGVRLSGITVSPSGRGPNGGFAISYSVSRAADVQVRLMTILGKEIAVIGLRSVEAGLNTVIRDGRAAQSPMARGLCLVELIASDSEGQTTRAVRTVPLR